MKFDFEQDLEGLVFEGQSIDSSRRYMELPANLSELRSLSKWNKYWAKMGMTTASLKDIYSCPDSSAPLIKEMRNKSVEQVIADTRIIPIDDGVIWSYDHMKTRTPKAIEPTIPFNLVCSLTNLEPSISALQEIFGTNHRFSEIADRLELILGISAEQILISTPKNRHPENYNTSVIKLDYHGLGMDIFDLNLGQSAKSSSIGVRL